MSVLTHVIAQFSEGQISITPTVQQPQDIVAAQNGSTGQVLTVPLATLAPVQALQLQSKEDPDIERDKQEIYRHPLFPLMALMFERCEHASATPNFSGTANFDSDIQAFIRHQEKENKTILGENEELNNLMIKAIQVLRIHLMELEKVSDLCKDFCTRYTSCLKGKLQSENLLRTESDYDQSMFDEPPQETPKPVQNMASPPAGNVILQQPFQTSIATVPTLGPGQVMSGGTVYQMVQTAQGLVAQPVQLQPAITSIATPLIHGSTPLSQLGVQAQPSPSATSSTINIVNTVAGVTGFDSDDEDSGKKKNKRGVLPKAATQIMKSWLFQHIVHPYPTEDEKRQIASQTNLTLLQVNNWFINARRRILQPMLDAGNPDQSKAKKAKPQSKPSQRFWPFNSNNSDSSTSYSLKCDESSLPTETVIASSGDTVVLSSGVFAAAQDSDLTSQNGVVDGGEIYLEMPEESQTSPPSANDKDNTSDNNNNSQNTDNDISDSEDLT